MLYLKWLCLIPVSLVMAIVGRVLAPVLPFFVQADGYLPRWLWWFQTPDNPCDGDKGHWERWPVRLGDLQTPRGVVPPECRLRVRHWRFGTKDHSRRLSRHAGAGRRFGSASRQERVLGQTRLSRRKVGLLARLSHQAVELLAGKVLSPLVGVEAF